MHNQQLLYLVEWSYNIVSKQFTQWGEGFQKGGCHKHSTWPQNSADFHHLQGDFTLKRGKSKLCKSHHKIQDRFVPKMADGSMWQATYLMSVSQSDANAKVARGHACHAAANQASQHNNMSVPDTIPGANKCSSSKGISSIVDSRKQCRYSIP